MQKETPRESPTGNSFIQAFTDCPKKWAFKYLMQWLPDKEKNTKDYFVFGQAFHLFKEWFYLNKKLVESEQFSQGLELGHAYIKEHGSVFEPQNLKELHERLDNAVEIWLNKYGKTEHERYEVIGTEMENILILPNNFKISVRYDAVLRDRETNFVYIFDSKTTRAQLTDTIEKYRYSSQPFIYCASVMQSDYSWKSDFRGWITDAIFNKKFVRDGWRCEIKRSEVVFYTEDQVRELLKSLTITTDEMLFCTEQFLSENKSLGESFRMDRSKCYQKFSGLCPYYNDCLREWSKENVREVPNTNYCVDKWTGFDIIQNNLSGIFKNETTHIKGMDG